MLRQIPVSEVKLGMYIHEICGSWMDHPFWRSGFLLDSNEDLLRLKQSAVTRVWIDTNKGLDTDKGLAETEVEQQAGILLDTVATTSKRAVSLGDELRRASKICNSARKAVMGMFGEARMGQAIDVDNAALVVDEISESVARHPTALLSLARLKQADEYTYMHSVAVGALMVSLARQLKMDEQSVREAGLAGLLHDVGKISINEEVLNKPSSLTDEEFAQIRLHPQYGARILQRSHSMISTAVYNACLQHHEKIDGSGYPYRLKKEQISMLARMTTVCDVYDAVTSDRPYKKGWGPAEAIQRMAQWQGHFDRYIFQAFVRTVGIYPIGSLVSLSSGRLAVVTDHHEDSLLKPSVKVFFSARSKVPIEQEIIRLGVAGCEDEIVARERVEDWGFKNIEQLWLQ